MKWRGNGDGMKMEWRQNGDGMEMETEWKRN